MRGIFDTATQTLVIVDEISSKTTLARLKDVQSTRARVFPAAPPHEESTIRTMYQELLERAHNGSGIKSGSVRGE